MYSVIMTTKGLWPMTETCLRGMDKTIEEKYDLCYVDADLANPDEERLREWAKTAKNLRTLHYEIKDCFIAPGWNRAIEMSQTEDVCILNNDYEFYRPGWLQLLDKRLKEHAKVGIVGSYGMSMFGWPFADGILVARRNILYAVAEDGKIIDEFYKHSCTNVDLSIRLQIAGYESTNLFNIEFTAEPYAKHLTEMTEKANRDPRTLLKRREPERARLIDKFGRRDGLVGYEGVVEVQ